jgi:hypothetical protein
VSDKMKAWLKGLLAGTIAGGAGGIVTGFAAMGIDPEHFNMLAGGIGHLLQISLVAFGLHAVLGAAMYLQKSPVPQ